MGNNRNICFIIIFLFFAFFECEAQQLYENLPKLFPSYTETFSDYKSNPSMCFNLALFDEEGRMWLTPCTGSQTGLHLFQFDGYDFSAVRGKLDQLPTDSKFLMMDDMDRLVGFTYEPGDTKIIFFDPNKDKLITYKIPVSGSNIVNKVFYDENSVLKIHLITENQFLQFELKDNELVQTHNIEHDAPLPQVIIPGLGDQEFGFWYFSPSFLNVIRFEIESGTRKTYSLNDIETPEITEEIPRPLIGKMYFLNGNCFLSLMYSEKNKSVLLKLNSNTDQFEVVKAFPEEAIEIQVFSDEKGQILFLARYNNNRFKAVLEDQDGLQFDYSAFFPSDLRLGTNINVKSPDFKKQLVICHSQGILLQSVKATEAINPILSDNPIRAMVELPNNNVLISTQNSNNKYIYNHELDLVQPWNNTSCSMAWAKLLKDKDGFIWGIDNQSFIKYDPILNNCEVYPSKVDRNVIEIIDNEKIAFITENRLEFFEFGNKGSTPFYVNEKPLIISSYVHDMLYSQDGILWIATSKGLIKVDIDNKKVETIGLNAPFLDFRFLCIHEDEKGRLWLGTPLGGIHIFDPKTNNLKILNSENGLANNTVVSIIEDNDGDRWVGTYNGISIVSAEGELITNLYVEDGLVNREANRYAYLKASNGDLLIGTVNGLNIIEPDKVKQRFKDNGELKIYLTSINYFDANENREVSKRNGFQNLNVINLPADRKNLRLKFAISNYFNPKFNQYSYRFEGINDHWIPIGNQNFLSLNNMPSGNYRLLLRGSDGSGNWTKIPLALEINAKEFFYKQSWFYVLCFSLLGGLIILWIQRLRSAVKKATKTILKDKETIEKQSLKLLELDHAKSQFFTNISHEFRTPLTIISGMAGQIIDNPQEWALKGGQMIKQNSSNLLNLVNQILDLRKLEARELKLNMVQGDVVKYLDYLAQSYQPFAQSMGIQLHYLPAIETLIMDYDPEKLLRIISNLLSNAVKYTPNKGNIYVHVNKAQESGNPFLNIRVEDTGKGINSEQLPYIFDRFYQADDTITGKGQGTGIGLALARELVQLMGGSLEVKSTLGKGTAFTILLPVTNKSNVMESPSLFISHSELSSTSQMNITTHLETNTLTNQKSAEELPSLLIIEDNSDIRQFLAACLNQKYNLTLAANGQEGIDIALETVPDLIISDVMMPEKDGYELCETLKEDIRTSHIPIILLTAKTDLASKISGLKTGADAYLTKPFEQEELLVRLEKLFELRQKLQARYQNIEPAKTPENKEDEFIQKVREVILNNLSDESFGIVQICRAISLSRAQLHNKLKALTGLSTSHFVRSIRLKKAHELLISSELNVSEVAYEVGFKNPSHFSTSYLEEFGFPPSKTPK